MKLLALDTSTDNCSCALWLAGDIHAKTVCSPQQHVSLILPMIDSLLNEAGLLPQALDAVAFGCGPGSFTGLRIACGVAQGIGLAVDCPLIPISSLATLAQGAYQTTQVTWVLTALDARMNEVYWGEYSLQGGIMQPVRAEMVCSPEQVPIPDNHHYLGIGSGWATYAAILQARLTDKLVGYDGQMLPEASAMIPLAQAAWQAQKMIPPEKATPAYLRNQIVTNSA